jgi:hypothetical protein
MPRRAIALILTVLLTLSGCTVHKVQQVPTAGVPQPLPDKERIVGITTLKGEDVRFDDPGASIVNGTLHGWVKKATYELPMDQVQRLWVDKEQISTARTIGLVAGVAVGTIVVIAAVVAATKQSCPFVYSWDGTRYVFDAEPYGGAIARGLEKDDYSELGQLREADGRYKLRMTNEVDETQMTNLTELWVVDHPAGTRVVPDIQGKLHTVAAPQDLLAARDAEGHDLLPWLRATDRLIWEPPSVPDASGSLQGDITMTFPKPADAKQVKLIANAATGLWGSYMIKQMVALRGRDVGKFYTAVNHSQSARKALSDWEVRGILPGTGPFISTDRILPLDVSRVQGNQLHIQIHPPVGFWALNSFAVDYTADRPVSVQTVKPSTAQDLQGKNAMPMVRARRSTMSWRREPSANFSAPTQNRCR